jgi:uncharacterized membrane protein YgcG
MTGSIKRFFLHLFSAPWLVRRYFSPIAMSNIEQAIERSERSHSGQICFVIEASLHPYHVLTGLSPRERALEVFSGMRVWDTEQNNGVLIYLLMVEHDVEIVADRGIDQRIPAGTWEQICRDMEQHFAEGQFETGLLYGVDRISQLLQQQYPAYQNNENELPDSPVII